jgi:hypothetical protein
MGLRRVIFVAAALVGVAGCLGDKSASLAMPATLAVGTYSGVRYGDACTGSKADLCSSETVQRIETITIDPPGMVEIITVDQVPADLQQAAQYDTPYAVHGLAAGSGKVCIKALFSDGTNRQACAALLVAEIAHVGLTPSFDLDGALRQPLVPPGLTLPVSVQFQAADGTVLGGDTLHSVDDGELVAGFPEEYSWVSPSAGGSLTIGSRLDPSFSETLATYAPGDVTVIHGAITETPPVILTPQRGMEFHLMVDVGGRRAAIPTAVSVRTDTPDICTGDQGVLTWTEGPNSNEGWFTAVSEGTCHLGFGVPGGTADLGTFDSNYYVVDSQDFLTRDQSAGDACGNQNLQVCSRDRSTVLVCRSKKWAVATGCNPGICDYTASASACTSPDGCVACR